MAMETDWWIDHGPYSEFGDLLTSAGAVHRRRLQHPEHPRPWAGRSCTNHAWGSAFRAYGSPQAFLASEIAMDDAGGEDGHGPVRVPLPEHLPPGRHHADRPDAGSVTACEGCSTCCARSTRRPRSAASELSTPEKKRGVGIALGIYGCGLDGPDGSEAAVELTRGGVTVYNTWQDHGQGADLGTLDHGPRSAAAARAQAGADQAGHERHRRCPTAARRAAAAPTCSPATPSRSAARSC